MRVILKVSQNSLFYHELGKMEKIKSCFKQIFVPILKLLKQIFCNKGRENRSLVDG
jgi:hypothetical protein